MVNGLLLGKIANAVRDNNTQELILSNCPNQQIDRQLKLTHCNENGPICKPSNCLKPLNATTSPLASEAKKQMVSVSMIFVFFISILCLGFDQPSVR